MRLPSNDQSGECASVPGLSRVTPLPSAAFIFKISELPKRVLMNTIEAPSRDHDASVSSAGSFVRLIGVPPGRLTTKISPLRLPTTDRPSADHLGRSPGLAKKI